MTYVVKNTTRITASQLRAARGLLDWNGTQLSDASGVSLQTIRRMESKGTDRSTLANIESVRRALENAGVVFLPADTDANLGPGVRLK